MTEQTAREFFIAGGTLRPDAPSYIERQADQELYDATLRGDFCYVLTSRQMGKSSLMARTAKRLKRQGVNTAIIDLTQIGGEQTTTVIGEWYYGILHQILRSLGIKADLQTWWKERQQISPVQRLTECFNDLILQQTQEPIVIFIDEIDSTINLPFTDDFFAAIRACHNVRATNEAYQRLTFVLLGVATPSQLVKDQTRTPFNVGHRIDLTDFSWEEARPLAQGLGKDSAQSEALLQRVLEWTGGHPYLTQKLCHLLAQENGQTQDTRNVDSLVEQHFLSPESSKDEYNLKFVRDRVTGDAEKTIEILQIYRNILKGNTIADNTLSPVHTTLKLSGLVVPQSDGTLIVRNKIYRQVFNLAWVNATLPRDRVKWTVVGTAAACLLAFIVWYQLFLPKPYIQQLQLAKEDVPTEAYESLKSIPGFANKADELLAQYWDRRAILASAQGDRDRALIAQLQALLVYDIPRRRQKANILIGNDYELLQATLRHSGSVYQAAFSPDGQDVVTVAIDGAARVWPVDGSDTSVLVGSSTSEVAQAAYSPDGRYLVSTHEDKKVRLWDAHTLKMVKAMEILHTGYRFDTFTFALAKNGEKMIVGGYDGQAWLLDFPARKWVGIFDERGFVEKIGISILLKTQVAVSPNGELISTTSRGRFGPQGVTIWNFAKREVVETFRPLSSINSLSFGPKGRQLLLSLSNGTAQVLKADFMGEPTLILLGHKGAISNAEFSPDGSQIVTASGDGTARLWQTNGSHGHIVLRGHANYVNHVSFSANGKHIVTASGDGTARIWKIDGNPESSVPKGHKQLVTKAAFSPDGEFILTASWDGTARVWPTEGTGEPVVLKGHTGRVNQAAFSPDAQLILTVSDDSTVRVWPTEGTGEPVVLKGHTGRVNQAAFSPDAQLILTVSDDSTVRVWPTEGTGEPVVLSTVGRRRGLSVAERVTHASFSPDAQYVVTASTDGTAWVWRADGTGEPVVLSRVERRRGVSVFEQVTNVAFSPDAQYVVTASTDGTAWVWRADGTGEPVVLKGHTDRVNQAAFSPDAQLILTVSDDSTVRVWRANGRGEPVVLSFIEKINDVSFNTKGTRLLVATGNRWVHLFSVQSETGSQSLKIEPLSTRLVPFGLWSGAYRFDEKNPDLLHVGLLVTGNGIKTADIRFDIVDALPIEGDPKELLETWKRTLALKFDADGTIVPRWPVGESPRISSGATR